MKKALITGALGQDGTYLIEHLLSLGYRVYGIVRKAPEASPWVRNWLYAEGQRSSKVEFIYGDVRDELSLRAAIIKAWPDEIYNLAGQVFVPLSWQQGAETFDVNVGGLLRILKIVETVKRDTRVYQASSSEMFGNHEGSCTVFTPLNPTSPYGVSKSSAHKLVDMYRQKGLYVVAGILFNHESPRRGHEMVTRKIAAHVAGWAAGDQTELFLGNVKSRRDWGFAGEYVKAMHLMLQQPKARDYVVGTGVSHSVEDFLNESCKILGIDQDFVDKHVLVDERLTRIQEIYDMHADNRKTKDRLGWEPAVDFHQLVSMMVNAEQLRLKEHPSALKAVAAL